MDILISIAAKIAEYSVAPIGRQLGYLCFYNKNVNELKTQIKDLGHAEKRLQRKVKEADRNGKEVEDDVTELLSNVREIIEEDEKFIQDEEQANMKCCTGAFPNLVLRHRLSREAKKKAQKLVSQIKDVDTRCEREISYNPPPTISFKNKGYEEFESRKQTFREIMEAVEDPNVGVIGVWGMGGVGKTMLAKEVAIKAKDELNFEEVVFFTMSQTPNIEKILDDIRKSLGMNKDGDVLERIKCRLKKENNILLVVDDVWKEFDLEDVGISFGNDQTRCKILMTSRDRHVLENQMEVNKIFEVKLLSRDEAIHLFRKITRDQAGKCNFPHLATQIVGECGDLPIAIATVASALKNQRLPGVWNNFLLELKKAEPVNIRGMDEKVYHSIKLSYDFLGRNEEAKKLLWLCSLFPEDAEIPVKLLCDSGVFLNIFRGINKLEEARDKTDTIVRTLLDRSLLLLGRDGQDYVKLHDVIQDVVVSIASKAVEQLYDIRNAVELKDEEMFKVSTAVSLNVNEGRRNIYSRDADSKRILEALQDPNVGILGLWGRGGVGKTTLAKEIARKAKDELKLFSEVVFITISQSPNFEKIRVDVQKSLGTKKPEDKILVVIDDIWETFELAAVGISLGSDNKGWKVLMTSRSREVLMIMGVGESFMVNPWLMDEAMSLFNKIVGYQAQEPHFEMLAMEIVKECGGLPISVIVLASALKSRRYEIWRHVLYELRNKNNIGMHDSVYFNIKLGYDFVESEEAKKLLLLCSLFGEDAEIPVKMLCNYGVGLNMFRGTNTVEDARDKTVALVKILMDHSLLFLGSYSDHVKVHDLIRDVVLSITSEAVESMFS